MQKIINKGTGAGGSNTNKVGLCYEKNTDIIYHLIDTGYIHYKIHNTKTGFYYKYNDIVYTTQSNFKQYMKCKFDLKMIRHPDEAYIINNNTVKILEKKAQTTKGSVETKLWASIALKREYEIILPNFKIEYALSLSPYFKTCFETEYKYKILKDILDENSIKVFFGNDDTYKTDILDWVNQ